VDPTQELTRCAAAIVIGAFIGLERQARHEVGQAFDRQDDSAPPPDESPDQDLAPEQAAVGAPPEGDDAAPESEPTEAAAPPTSTSPPEDIEVTEVPEGLAGDPIRPDSSVPDFAQVTGVRTFAILALLGALSALSGTSWAFPLTLAVVGAFLSAGYIHSSRVGGDWGLTSELAALSVFLLGGLCGEGRLLLAGAAGLAISVLLSYKQRIHSFASRIRRRDAEAVLKFAALSLVVLPLLPTEPVRLWPKETKTSEAASSATPSASATPAPTSSALPLPSAAPSALPLPSAAPTPGAASTAALGSGEAVGGLLSQEDDQGPWWKRLELDLRKVWWMVILISSVSFAGFILGKFMGTERGLMITALIGGLVSSTAVTLTYAQRSRETPELSSQFLAGILAANVIMPLRVLVVLLIVSPVLASRIAIPMIVTALAGCLIGGGLYLRRSKDDAGQGVDLKNPFELGPAIQFGALFAFILLLAQIAGALFGAAGLYGLSVISGLTDVDAIVLACADLVGREEVKTLVATTMVTLAVISNTAVKGGILVGTGARELRGIAILAFGGMLLAAGGGLALAWRVFA
jgi:uncharacterized membrane protein (DUF4010 family)